MATYEFEAGMKHGTLNGNMDASTVQQRHSELVATLSKPGSDIILDLTPMTAELFHMASAAMGEAGELYDAIKKHAIYKKELDMRNVIEELGDIEFYLERIRQLLSISRTVTLAGNHNKLERRYDGRIYTNDAAQTRADKNEEFPSHGS